MLRGIVLSLLVCLTTAASGVGTEQPIEVMFLGTYHIGNPGLDLNNMKPDNIFTPKRQKELDALVNSLSTFKPTLIMVEDQAEAPTFVSEYFAKFTRAKLATADNELAQVAFRLAYKLDIKKVHGIDEQPSKGEPDYFPFDKVEAYAKSHGLTQELKAWNDINARCVKANDEKLQKGTIISVLMDLNKPENPCESQVYNGLLRFGDGDNQPGADLNSAWYLRNAKIFSKLTSIAKPGDRIFLLFGHGHGYWLRHFIQETPGFKLVDPRPFLVKAEESAK